LFLPSGLGACSAAIMHSAADPLPIKATKTCGPGIEAHASGGGALVAIAALLAYTSRTCVRRGHASW
jgi:hypothetical protein